MVLDTKHYQLILLLIIVTPKRYKCIQISTYIHSTHTVLVNLLDIYIHDTVSQNPTKLETRLVDSRMTLIFFSISM